METRLWHWIPALTLAVLLHLLPFLWIGGGSSGEGEGRRFEGLSVLLQPLPGVSSAAQLLEEPQAAPEPLVESSPLVASPQAPGVSASVPASSVAEADTPVEVLSTVEAPAQVVTGEQGQGGAVVVADRPLQPLAGGLDVAPPSTTLEPTPPAAEIRALPISQVDERLTVDLPGVVPEVASETLPVPSPPADSPAIPESGEALMDQGPLLGADQPLPRVSTPSAPTSAELVEALPGTISSAAVTDILDPPTVGERGEAVPLDIPLVTTTSAIATNAPLVAPIPSLDQAGQQEALESVEGGVETDDGEVAPVTPPPPLAAALPPPPGGNTMAPSVSAESEAILPAGPVLGATGATVDGEAMVIDPIALTEPLAASVSQPPVSSEVAPGESLVAEEATLEASDGPALPAVELQSRSSPARSWADMLPAQMAARLATDPLAGQGELPEQGDTPGLVVDGALSSGDASARGRYLASVQSWLARHKHYPHQARQAGLEGDARLRLILNRFGEIQSYEFLQRTGHPLLDRAVEGLLKQAAPLPAMPGFLADDQLSMVVSISYRLE